MDSTSVRKVLTIVLLVCLLLILIVFCVVYFWAIRPLHMKSSVPADNNNADENRLIPTTEETVEFETVTDPSILKVTSTTQSSIPATGYRLRLNGDGDAVSGKVLIEYEGQTGFVCSDGFGHAEARVVCTELGFQNGMQYNLIASFPYSRYTEYEPLVSQINCTGDEANIQECDGFRLGNITSCTWFAAALCYDEKPYELRLVNGIMPDSGMVEMKVGGEWGILCAIRNFDDDVADILCRSMDFTGGLALDRGMLGETNNTNVWVPQISCTDGAEIKQSIFECNLVLNTENLLIDRFDHRNNRYRNEYMACLSKPNSYASAVQCLI